VAGTFGDYVVFHPAALAELLRGPDGPVARHLLAKGELVKNEARRRVGVYVPPDSFSASNRKRKPGQLRDSIVKRLVQDGGELNCLVGSEDPIALLHHEGTVPHIIRASRAPRLVFFWPKVGGVVGFVQVNHPGTAPNRYLTDSLSVIR
jgi:hypothetical protein